MTESIVSVVVERLSNLLIQEADIFQEVSNDVDQVIAELRKILDSLKDADLRQDYRPNVKTWLAEARQLAYDAEDLLERFVVHPKRGGLFKRIFNFTTLPNFKRQIRSTKARISDLLTRVPPFTSKISNFRVDEYLPRFYNHKIVEAQIFVGMKEDEEILLKHLVNDRDRVVTIHGMGGLGKTTLARKLYNHVIVKSHFTCLAWVSISQKWDTLYILRNILIQLLQDPTGESEILKMTAAQLQKEILGVFQNKKCLVVLDDIWLNDSWEDLKAPFSITGNGVESKLLLTTRNVEVAMHVDLDGFRHQPHFLNRDESWELLYRKAFPKNHHMAVTDVKKMEELGREMVNHCGGLPLAVAVLGGILVTKPTLTSWEIVHVEIKRRVGLSKELEEEVQQILASSFDDLPRQLVSCFMYLSKFAEDESIGTERLYQLWMAEGFLMSTDRREGETMMDVAECYLGELAHRSMVHVEYEDKKLSLRKFKACRLHDLMRDLSLKKANEVELFKTFDFRHGNNGEALKSSTSSSNGFRELVIYFNDDDGDNNRYDVEVALPDNGSRRKLRSFSTVGFIPKFITSFVNDFRLLRILAIERFKLSGSLKVKMSEAIGRLINLRYLSLKWSKLDLNISCIANLEHLQTLDLRLQVHSVITCSNSKDNVLLKAVRLQHLYLPDWSCVGMNFKFDLDGLSDLETLEDFSANVCDIQGLRKLRNLRKLICTGVNNIEDLEYLVNAGIPSNNLLRYSELDVYCNLDTERGGGVLEKMMIVDECLPIPNIHSLIIEGRIGKLPSANNVRAFSSNLTKLVLRGSKLTEDPMTTLEKYPNLSHLRLRYNSYLGKKMVCTSTGFPKLTHLELFSLWNLEEWRLEQGGMPQLSHLLVIECERLKMLPDEIRFLSHLQDLKIYSMSAEFKDRLRVVDEDGNMKEGPDFYKISHVPSIQID